jgi:thioester reductase-like protein
LLSDVQWPVNFNWSIASFEPHIRGVRSLVDLSLGSLYNAFLMFISSVSAVDSWAYREPVPEQNFPGLNVAGKSGYGQSKLTAEAILDTASRVLGVNTACCRVGIVAGPVESSFGIWNKHEYIPSVNAP